MSQNFTEFRALLLITIGFFTVSNILCESPPKFCDEDYINAVLWDGITYRVTRNQWIATYDELNGTVGEFGHKDVLFPNEKNFYFQSAYNITEVPKCDTTKDVNCLNVTLLKGLVVYLFYSENGVQYYKIEKQISIESLPYGLKTNDKIDSRSMFWPQNFGRENETHKPAIYSPNKLQFIYFINDNLNSILWINKLSPEKNFDNWEKILFPNKNIETFLSGFWWKFDKEVYLIGKRNSFVTFYKLSADNKKLIPINKSVKEFFGCETKINLTTGLSVEELNTTAELSIGNTSLTTEDSVMNSTSGASILIPKKEFKIWILYITIGVGLVVILVVVIVYYLLFKKPEKIPEIKADDKYLVKDQNKDITNEKIN